jgi:hypothetical protein
LSLRKLLIYEGKDRRLTSEWSCIWFPSLLSNIGERSNLGSWGRIVFGTRLRARAILGACTGLGAMVRLESRSRLAFGSRLRARARLTGLEAMARLESRSKLAVRTRLGGWTRLGAMAVLGSRPRHVFGTRLRARAILEAWTRLGANGKARI